MNKKFEKELVATIERIPDDLVIWEKEIDTLKGEGNAKKILEYIEEHSFYLGKLAAYLYVAKELGFDLKIKESSIEYIRNIIKDENEYKALQIISK